MGLPSLWVLHAQHADLRVIGFDVGHALRRDQDELLVSFLGGFYL